MQTTDYRDLHAREGGFALGESVGEAICGIATIVLAIAGLANAEWAMMAPVATIVAGAALVFVGAAHAARCACAHESEASYSPTMSAEFLAGVTGVILGVLALLGMASGILISAAIIVYGAALMLSSVSVSHSHTAGFTATGVATTHVATHTGHGAQLLVGLAVGVLGILALVGSNAATLNLVALLVVGAGILLAGTAITDRMFRALAR
jgi:hypothetical protein